MNSCIIEKGSGVTTLTLNRPHVLNALDSQLHQELQAAFDDFAGDEAQRICVVTGAGEKSFCVGSDIKASLAAKRGGSSYPKSGYAGLIERFDLSKPVIAAVNGFALGGGFEIVLACDLVIASEHATFGLPEPLIGAVALAGGVHRLVRQIGLKNAMGMILTSRRVSAAEGLRMGFVNEVVPADQLMAAVHRWCEQILRGGPLAIQASKETAMRGLDEPSLADAIRNQASYPAFAASHTSEERVEGMRAFAEKRPAKWQKS